ncbi:uncharacterized protein PV09_08472 [Verruconis gallopava]|uniref:Uncharacterized protein n=1 Tax=Verruconis gallopava TaxID=253628 RepID=A0A0D2A0Z9_9PEZI|nr:uncharacterized protein PV09_08472 [Verruconis gallopava]KIV99959.1 hypothetical protein PV09_08472 [Verruconis gallopava]
MPEHRRRTKLVMCWAWTSRCARGKKRIRSSVDEVATLRRLTASRTTIHPDGAEVNRVGMSSMSNMSNVSERFVMADLQRHSVARFPQITQLDGYVSEVSHTRFSTGSVSHPQASEANLFDEKLKRRTRVSDETLDCDVEEWKAPPFPPEPNPMIVQTVFQQTLFSERGPADVPLPPPTPDESCAIPDPCSRSPKTPPGEPPSQLSQWMKDRVCLHDAHLANRALELHRKLPETQTPTSCNLPSTTFTPRERVTQVNSLMLSPDLRRPSNTIYGVAQVPPLQDHRECEASILESLFQYGLHQRARRIRSTIRTSFTPDSLPSVGERPIRWWHEHAGGQSESSDGEASVGERPWPRWWRRMSLVSRTRAAARVQLFPYSIVPSVPLTRETQVRAPSPPQNQGHVPSSVFPRKHIASEDSVGEYEWFDPDAIGIAL